MIPASDPPSWQVLVGSFSIDRIEAELARSIPLLLVPNNPGRAAQLAHELEGRNCDHLFLCHELLASEDGEICWYLYSDDRFDGCNTPEEVQRLAPNVQLRDLELRRVVRLDSLIHGWANHEPSLAALVAAGGGKIWLRCKHPEPIVAGSIRLVNVIAEFRWTPLGSFSEESETAALAEWLEPSLFHPLRRDEAIAGSSLGDLVWLQDPLRLARFRQQQLEDELNRRQQESAGLMGEKEALLQQQEALLQEKETLQGKNEVLHQEQERLRLDRDDLLLQRQALEEAVVAAEANLTALREELEESGAEKIALREQHTIQESRISELESRVRALEALSGEALVEIEAIVALLAGVP